MTVQIKELPEKSVPERFSESFLQNIENEICDIEKSIKIIENKKDEFPWVIDKLNEKMRLKYEPALNKSTYLLQFCTKESILRNYDNLVSYYHKLHSLMKETAEQQIYELLNHEKIEAYDSDLYRRELLVTFWHDDKERALTHELDKSSYDEHLSFDDFRRLPRRHEILQKIPQNKNNYYCLYFSDSHSIQDLEWFLKNRLSKIIRSDSELKYYKPNTVALKKRALVGYLMILGVKPRDIKALYNYFSPKSESISDSEIKKIKSRFVKDKCFEEAGKEFEIIKSKKATIEVINRYLTEAYAGLIDDNGNVRSFEDIKLASIPRFLELECINEGKNLSFHLRPIK